MDGKNFVDKVNEKPLVNTERARSDERKKCVSAIKIALDAIKMYEKLQ